ncbi:glutamine-hydrolyzing GMP synthase [Mycoplasma marinum]|uniref:GMP synthase [glutamine-hydrolyzing] n=1 Tax=Mycoplasma marinum TaxID=1937190 RepID=A0A4R0XSM9_9MOLU|nr:glutamine-hydrolyzing GMP synthase [Mycoplasma marinum]TCG11440.1 GMP synthase (glutamine-hydrolyzing) [Mycoplasma marinum]
MNKVLVVDFGSQYCKLIARRVRDLGVYSEIISPFSPNIIEIAKKFDVIILSGGPSSVFEENSLSIDKEIFEIGKPILGTCYGMQLIHHLLGGKVETLKDGEYGKVSLTKTMDHPMLKNIEQVSNVWMSHFDTVTEVAPGFKVIAKTDLCNAMTINDEKKIYTYQFHAEVTHTEFGKEMIANFLFEIAKLKPTWKVENLVKNKIEEIKKIVGDKKVILGLSGGVDSSVVAMLLHKAIGKQLTCIFVNHGLLRKNEVEEVQKLFGSAYDMNLVTIDAKDKFYSALKNVSDPETKRKIIGKLFVDVFTEAKATHSDAYFLAQGTIYPDLIESSGINGTAKVIKSHHNVGGLPDELEFKILEPLNDLFKDEVRKLGLKLGLPKNLIMRHPFPGPGLAIRIIGSVDAEKVRILQEVDNIFISNLREAGLYDQVSQAFAVLTPIKTVGVQGDERTYAYTAALRSVDTVDFMTATFSQLPYEFIVKVSSEITNKVKDVNRVVYDITSKPPSTIEWE